MVETQARTTKSATNWAVNVFKGKGKCKYVHAHRLQHMSHTPNKSILQCSETRVAFMFTSTYNTDNNRLVDLQQLAVTYIFQLLETIILLTYQYQNSESKLFYIDFS